MPRTTKLFSKVEPALEPQAPACVRREDEVQAGLGESHSTQMPSQTRLPGACLSQAANSRATPRGESGQPGGFAFPSHRHHNQDSAE